MGKMILSQCTSFHRAYVLGLASALSRIMGLLAWSAVQFSIVPLSVLQWVQWGVGSTGGEPISAVKWIFQQEEQTEM